MKTGRIAFAAGALVVAAALAGAMEVQTSYDPKADFSAYLTYSWGTTTSPGGPAAEERVREAADAWLQSRGWKKVEEGKGDVTLAVSAVVGGKADLGSFYGGWAGWSWRGWGEAADEAAAPRYEEGTLVLDAFDTKSKQLIWRGLAMDALSPKPEKDARRIGKAVAKILADFPAFSRVA